MTDEYFFKYGYSLFCLEKYVDAKYNLLKVQEGKYKDFSHNIFIHISMFKNYIINLFQGFNPYLMIKCFSRIVHYYITQIYFYLEEYSVVECIVPLLENVLSSRESEINRIVSDSYYHLSDYESAIIYFNRYLEITEETPQLIIFR